MQVSLEWLRQYADLDAPIDTIVDALVDTGTEVDRVHRAADGVIVARVLRLEPVPGKALTFVDIDAGESHGDDGVVRLITGAGNLSVGDLVPWAPPGTLLPGWDTPLGVRVFFNRYESPGMLCSPTELGIDGDADGIHIVESGTPGVPLHEVIPSDAVLAVEPTTNRPDCMCHVGIARELAAALDEALRPPPDGIPARLVSAASVGGRVTVRNAVPEGCLRFTAALIENVSVGPSPEWLQRRLRAVGQRPINNVVDVTNYVMLELGQPLHAFDSDRFIAAGGGGDAARVVIRRGRQGDSVACLDGVDRVLTGEDIAVCSADVAVSVAGIIGGASTAVDEATHGVLLEAASWNGILIRASSQRLGRRTEASSLFEKDLSDDLPPVALARAAALIAELGGGQVLSGVVDVDGNRRPPVATVEITAATISRRLGCTVDADEASTALAQLGFAVEQDAGSLRITPPHFRRDVGIPEDIVEEVGRSIGYGRVPSTLPGRRTPVASLAPPVPVDERVRDVCIGAGLDEAITYSFTSSELAGRLTGWGGGRAPIELRNPLSEEWAVLRISLLPGLCHAVAANLHHGAGDVALFEIGRAYWEGERTGLAEGSTPDGLDAEFTPLPAEPLLLGLAVNAPADGAEPAAAVLRHVRSLIDRLGGELTGTGLTVEPAGLPGLHPGRSGRLRHDGQNVGLIGELHPDVAARFDIRDRVVVAEFDVGAVVSRSTRRSIYRTPPRYPAVVQDLAVTVAPDVLAGRALQTIHDAGGGLLETADLYDEYRGHRIAAGRKSWTFRLTFRAGDRTLSGAEASAAQSRIAQALATECGAELRS